jgi:hypothetical protein
MEQTRNTQAGIGLLPDDAGTPPFASRFGPCRLQQGARQLAPDHFEHSLEKGNEIFPESTTPARLAIEK